MPPVNKSDRSTFRKDVDFVAKDDAEQIATGIVMVPNAVDLQNDWETPETIQQLAERFGNFYEVDESGNGVMHAVFPDEHATLERNEVLEEDTEIDGTTAPEGAWVQEWRFEDEELWELVADGILEGYSIGAVNVHWNGPMEQDELPDEVTVPDAIDEDELVWELVDAIVREVSAVDIPAVPDAQILETKSAAEKRLADHLGNRDGFIEEAQQRGHSEGEAERLWNYLNRAVDIEGAGEPGKQSVLAKAGKAFLSALSGTESDDDTESKTSEPPDPDGQTAKEGRTLSRQNRHSEMASIDASLDVLEDAGVDHGMTRFTDREDTNFDLSEHTARDWPDPNEDEDDEDSVGTDGPPFESAAGGDTPDDNTTMSNEDDPMADAPEWAKALNDRIDNLESEEKDAGAGDADVPMADAPEWAKSLDERINEIEEKALDDGEDKPEWAKSLEARIDAISKQTGTDTQQIGKVENEENEKNSGFTLDPRKARGN